jgi:hypothetical protein
MLLLRRMRKNRKQHRCSMQRRYKTSINSLHKTIKGDNSVTDQDNDNLSLQARSSFNLIV